MKTKLLSLFPYTFLLIMFNLAGSANFNHDYPRLGMMQWGGGVDEWYARFDILMLGNHNSGWAQSVHNLNPNTIILPTQDFNAGGGVENGDGHGSHPEYYTYHANGTSIALYFGYDHFWNMSVICPKSASHNNLMFCEYLPEFLVNKFNMTIWDGLASDGMYDTPTGSGYTQGDIDLDRNGANDFTEYPQGWADDVWVQGTNTIFTKLRQLIPQDKYILMNNWRWGTQHFGEVNGWFIEHAIDDDPGAYDILTYVDNMNQLRQPNCIFMDGESNLAGNVKWMRFQLAFTLLGNGYYSWGDAGSSEHTYNKYMDEFDVNLGTPTGDYQKIGTVIKVRFFSNGVAINCNGNSGGNVTDTQLKALVGYNGPYYFFLGNQDKSRNSGTVFSSLTFTGKDGVLLVKNPEVAICDIIMDNEDHATTPRQSPALLTGTWTGGGIGGSNFYRVGNADWSPGIEHNHMYSNAGGGENSAMFRASIYVAGKYNIYEWHGDAAGAASNVPVLIKHKNGFTSLTIDQSQNKGRWNFLGEFEFTSSAADSKYVQLSNKANGKVLADAVKFVSTVPEYTPPTVSVEGKSFLNENLLRLTSTPNPFNSKAQFDFAVPVDLIQTHPLRIEILDVSGGLIKTFHNPQNNLIWDAKDQTAGVYFVKLTRGTQSAWQRILLVK